MNEEKDYKALFIKGSLEKLSDLKAAIKEVEAQLDSDDDGAIKLAIAWSRLCHEFMLKDAIRMAMLMIQEKPVYQH